MPAFLSSNSHLGFPDRSSFERSSWEIIKSQFSQEMESVGLIYSAQGASHVFLGPEVVSQATRVFDKISEVNPSIKFNLVNKLFGGCAIDATGEPLPSDTLESCRASDAVLMGGLHEARRHRLTPRRLRWWS